MYPINWGEIKVSFIMFLILVGQAFFVSRGIWLVMLDPNLCFHFLSKNKAPFNLGIPILIQGNWSSGAVSNKAETS